MRRDDRDETPLELTGADAKLSEAETGDGENVGIDALEDEPGRPHDIWPDQVRFLSRSDEREEERELEVTARPRNEAGLRMLRL